MPREFRFPILRAGAAQACVRVTMEDDAALDYLHALATAPRAPEDLWNPVGRICRREFARKFQVGGDPKWAELAQRTVNEKRRLIQRGSIPPRTPKGKTPPRLLQNGEFTERTILIRTGKLRDSWVRKGARGHVEQVDGDSFFIGSQLTVEKELGPEQAEKDYHILTRKARKLRARGQTVTVLIPLARFHEEGTERMPARPVAVNADGEALLGKDAFDAIERAALRWMLGSDGTPGSGAGGGDGAVLEGP